jgi:thiamine pyridinylase
MTGPGIRKGALGEAYTPPPPPPSDDTTLNVALYPYVPSRQAWVTAVQMAWQRVHPEITLEFAFYDPYTGPPPSTLDVFAFDCIYVDDLMASKTPIVDPILASEVDGLADILDVAQANAAIPGNRFAGIPYLCCTQVLYYRLSDSKLNSDAPLGVGDLFEIVGPANYSTAQPPPGVGLILDLHGDITDACTYAALWRQYDGTWWPDTFPTKGDVNPYVFVLMNLYGQMTGRAGGLYKDTTGFARTNWFAGGFGEALVGLTETMSAWTPAMLGTIGFRPLPIAAEGDADRLLFFADAVGIRPGLSARRPVALELANLIASPQVAMAALAPTESGAQYLIPARRSVFKQLAATLPMYAAMVKVFEAGGPPTPYRLGPGAWTGLPTLGTSLIADLFPPAEEVPAEEVAPALPPHLYGSTPGGMWSRGR